MEKSENSRKLGFGIVFIAILSLIGNLIGLFAAVKLYSDPAKYGGTTLSSTSMIITIVLAALLVVSLFLILAKKPLGAYLFIAITVLNYIYGIITMGFSISSLMYLIFPIILILLLFRKKEIFFS